MTEQNVSRRYAKSLINAALSHNKLEQVYQDINLVIRTLKENKQLRSILQNPIIRGTKKLTVLQGVFAPHLDKLTMAELELLAKKSREEILYDICENFNTLYYQHKNMVFGEVISAIPLDKTTIANLEKTFSAKLKKQVTFNAKVDTALIGGLIINIEGNQIDNSIRKQLQKLKQQFSQK